MNKAKVRKFTGARFCWHCSKKLRLPHFTEHVVDGTTNVVRVHKICNKELKRKFVEEFDGDRRGFWEDDK